MNNKVIWLIASCLMVTVLLMPSCGPAVTEEEVVEEEEAAEEEEEAAPPEEEEEVAPSPTPTAVKLEVHFIDVGQGDSILVDLGDIEILIDAGGKSPGVTACLNDYVDGAIEVLVATHPHADHIGGLIAVLDAFEVDEIWHNGDESASQTYGQFMAAIETEEAVVHTGRKGKEIIAGELTFLVLHPTTTSGSTNNNSIVLSLSYGEVDFLFTGDAEQDAEASMLADGIVPDVEILKVGHHGSRSSSSQSFLAVVQPEVAIYMAKEGNSYGHPHEETILALSNAGADIYGTDVHGTIIVITDGETYGVQLTNNMPAIVPPVATEITYDLNISINGQGTTNPGSSSHTYDEGAQVSITALPDSGWSFDHWNGDASGDSPNIVITMDTNKNVTACFKEVTARGSDVQITRIFYDGVVPRVESDEYVEITNLGDEPQDLTGWELKDISEGYPSFTFPHYILEPGGTIRVYTNEVHSEWGGFSFGYGKAIWNNKDPDIAALYDAQGHEVSRRSY